MLLALAESGDLNTGQRDRLVTFQRGAATVSEQSGGETLAWAALEQAWARVRFGRADENRRAAQEGGLQAASFEVVPTTALLGVTLRDRILFDGAEWDITEAAPLDRNLMRFTATRAV
jgi:head-tail adaptor